MSIDNLQPAQAHIHYQSLFSCMTFYAKHSVLICNTPALCNFLDRSCPKDVPEWSGQLCEGLPTLAGFWEHNVLHETGWKFPEEKLSSWLSPWTIILMSDFFFLCLNHSFFCVILIIAFVQTLSLWWLLFHFLSAQSETAGSLNP